MALSDIHPFETRTVGQSKDHYKFKDVCKDSENNRYIYLSVVLWLQNVKSHNQSTHIIQNK